MREPIKRRILLVEDEVVVAMVERRELESAGYEVTVADTGEKALELVSGSWMPDLILMDIDLGPGIDGTVAARAIMRIRHIPIVFLSSHTEKQYTELAEQITSYGYVVKNSSLTVLLASVKTAFRLHEAYTALHEREAQLREAQEINLTGRWDYWHYDNNLLWTPMIYRIFGLAEDEFEPSYDAFLAVIHPEDRTAVDTAWKRSLEAQCPYEIDHRLQMPDGRVTWVREHCRTVFDSAGLPVHSIGIVQDITGRKTLEVELVEQNQYLKTILATTSDGFWVVTPEQRISSVNAAYCRMSGYTADELTAMTINDLDAVEAPEETVARVRQILETGSQTFETKHRRKDGAVIDVEVSASRLDRPDGVYTVCFCRDVTQRQKTRNELEQSRHRYQTLVDHSPDIIYLFGAKQGGLFWSKATKRILGYDPEEILRDRFLWTRSVHPDDKPVVEKAIASAINGELFNIEYRIQTAQRDWVWLRDRMIDRTVTDGDIVIQGHAEDITAQKRYQQQLAEQETLLKDVLDNMLDFVTISDLAGTFTFASRSHERLGYDGAALVGQNVLDFVHPDDLAYLTDEFAKLRHNGFAPPQTYRYRCADGSYTWLETTARLLKAETEAEDRAGAASRIIFNTRDITEKKRQEQKYLALTAAAATLQGISSDTVDYSAMAETAKELSDAAFVVFNEFDNSHASFTTQALVGIPHFAEKAAKLLGFSLVGQKWGFDPDREAALGTRQTTVFPTLSSLASGQFSVAAAVEVAKVFEIGEVVIVRVAADSDIHGDFTLFFTDGAHLERKDLIETYAMMVGIALKRIQTERHNLQLVAEKETLLKEVHHRVKNNMNTMTSLLSLFADTIEDPASVTVIKEAESRLRSMQTLYDQLDLTGSHTNGSIGDYLKTLVPQIVALFPFGKQVAVSVTSCTDSREVVLDDGADGAGDGAGDGAADRAHCCIVDAKRLSTVGLIVNELVTNTMKYAFPPSDSDSQPEQPAITVKTDCREDTITVTVTDNGVGLPRSFDQKPSTGFGMLMIHAMVDQLSGSIEYQLGPKKVARGTQVTLSFPSARLGLG